MRTGRYIIRRQDRGVAIAFIEQQLIQKSLWIDGDEKRQSMAKQEYLDCRIDPDGINAWCAKWLNEMQWQQLKEAISNARYMQERIRPLQPLKTVSLSYQAWEILVDLAQRNNTTLSNVIITYLGKMNFAACIQTDTDFDQTCLNRDNPVMNA